MAELRNIQNIGDERAANIGVNEILDAVISDFPRAFLLLTYSKTVGVEWKGMTDLLNEILTEGNRLGPSYGASLSAPCWLNDIPSYAEAKEEWDLLEKNKTVVNFFLKERRETLLKFPQINLPGKANFRLTLFDRLIIIVLLYSHLYAKSDDEGPFEELYIHYLDFLTKCDAVCVDIGQNVPPLLGENQTIEKDQKKLLSKLLLLEKICAHESQIKNIKASPFSWKLQK